MKQTVREVLAEGIVEKGGVAWFETKKVLSKLRTIILEALPKDCPPNVRNKLEKILK